MLTYGDAKSSGRLNRVSGVLPISPDFRDLLNDGTRMLMTRGNWWGTVKRVTACSYACCITWPRYVHTVLAAKRCHHPANVRNNWYSMSEVTSSCVAGFRRDGQFCGDVDFEDRNTSPVFNPIACNTGMFLQFYPGVKEDVNDKKNIRVFGVDSNGQTVYTKHPDGTFQEGELLNFSNIGSAGFVQSLIQYRHVLRIKKDVTKGPVRGYQWDGTQRWDLAYYEPGESNPDYRVNYIRGCSGCNATNPPTSRQVTALVKLNFVPVVSDDDLVLIDNLDALAMAMQSLNLGDSYSRGASQVDLSAAVEELNRELESRFPDEQTTIVNNVLGPDVWQNRCF